MSARDWLMLALAAVILLAWYLSYSAARLDRMHARVEGTLAVLEAALVRRAEATLELANSGCLDPASGLLLADSAVQALSVGVGSPAEREAVESELSESLRLALTDDVLAGIRATDPAGADALDRLDAANDRVQLSRRFHNDAVTTVRLIRRKVVVRLFRLAGYAEMPRTVEFDDDAPASLRA